MIALVAVLAFAMLSLTALTADLGLAATEQNRLEVAAEAAALAALREEARLDHEADRGTPGDDYVRCSATASREACIAELAASRGSGVAYEILQGRADESGGALSPGADPTTLSSCGPGCWRAMIESSALPNDGAEVDLGPGDARIRLSSCGDACWEAEIEQAIPLLFGQASLLGFQDGESLRELLAAREGGSALVGDGTPTDPTDGLLLRTRGVPIRGLARANVQPVVRVGLPVVREEGPPEERGLVLPGRAPFALTLEAWDGLGEGLRSIELEGTELQLNGTRVGYRIGMGPTGLRAGEALGLGGEALGQLQGPDPSSPGPYLAYVPLTNVLPDPEVDAIVVGFGYARVLYLGSASGSGAGGQPALRLQRLTDRVAPGNASASPRFLAGSDVTAVLRERTENVVPVLLRAAVPR